METKLRPGLSDESERCDILHLSWAGRIGGIERHLEAILREAPASGRLAHRGCLLDGRGTIGDALAADGLADRVGLRAGWDLPGLVRLVRLLRLRRPRVVHSSTHAVVPTVLAWVVLRGSVRVYTEQSPRALAPDVKFRTLYRLLLRPTVSRFVALSPSMARGIEGYGVEPDRVRVIPNTFTLPRRADHRGPSQQTIGVVARLEVQKRVDLFLQILAALRARGVPCQGLVVGGGSCSASLLRQAHQAGLADAVRFAGEQQDVAPWLDQMSVFIMTSAIEPFGIAALEAMARGVPVVAMPCRGGLMDLVGRGGLVLADRTVSAAADAVALLLRSPEARRELRARGEALLAEHAPATVLRQLEDLYAELGVR